MQISRYEKGETSVTPALLDKICKAFNVDSRYFAEDVDAEDMEVEEAVTIISDEEKRKAVAARLREARQAKGWSQNELARRFGVNTPLINRVEFGALLTEKQGKKLAEALEVGIDWLDAW